MITLIILIALAIIGFYLNMRWDFEILGYCMWVVSILLLFPHVVAWGLASYEYGLFATKRSAFEQTLKEARQNGNEYETAAITKEVAQWNQKLAEHKYNNKTILLDPYIDDRMELLEPIK